MHARSIINIYREYEYFLENNFEGISFRKLTDDSHFDWIATIDALTDTQWTGGVFRVYVKFNEYYGSVPPSVWFHTIPFHPNIDPHSGAPCMKILDTEYYPNCQIYALSSLLLSLQYLVSNPSVEEPVNHQAAEMMVHNPAKYEAVVLDCITTSQRYEEGKFTATSKPSKVKFLPQTSAMSKQHPDSRLSRNSNYVCGISFDDYYNTWTKMATTTAQKDPLTTNRKNAPFKMSPGLSPYDQTAQYMQLLWYNTSSTQLRDNSENIKKQLRNPSSATREAKKTRIEKMRKLYLPGTRNATSDETSHPLATSPINSEHFNTDFCTREETFTTDRPTAQASDLVTWTQNLNELNLE